MMNELRPDCTTLSSQSLKRLVEDLFKDDVIGEFRGYCAAEPAWAEPVTLPLDRNPEPESKSSMCRPKDEPRDPR